MKRWTIKDVDTDKADALAAKIGVSGLIAGILVSRGYDTPESARKFLHPELTDLYEPFLLRGMKETVARVFEAIDNKEKILIWGDYDVDGTTGTVVLRKALSMLGAETVYHVPHRFLEGYGINIPELEKAKEGGVSLVISVDCGITAFEEAEWARENGVDLIITDHHLPKEGSVPDAYAVVNPNQPKCEYPDKNLAGVGVAFKLVHALLRERGKENMVPHFLKVVAIGTIADVVKLTDENRAIVWLGLKDLPKARNYGLKALMEVCDCTDEMTSNDIGFRLAPRINAAGRMDAAKHVVELLEVDSFGEARKLAEYLDRKNIERKKVQAEITQKAINETAELGNSHFVVVSGEKWHRGVIGLAASRVTEKLHRPTIVLSVEDGVASGSARSISGYHLVKALDSCSELFEKYGGHAAAAGMTLKAENIETLREVLEAHAARTLTDEDLIPEVKIDAEVESEDLNLELVDEIKMLEPFGMGNPRPVFLTRDLKIVSEPFVMKEKHLKLKLSNGSGSLFEAVWWDGVAASEGQTLTVGTGIELVYTPEKNTWNGASRLQLVIKDIRSI
ncbi:MAG: single-stranded-DNA-specific exonuclease RecJ [Pyrinomonadaceae bacterium]